MCQPYAGKNGVKHLTGGIYPKKKRLPSFLLLASEAIMGILSNSPFPTKMSFPSSLAKEHLVIKSFVIRNYKDHIFRVNTRTPFKI